MIAMERASARRPRGRRGTVYLVGAGPGDPNLLTLRAAELLGFVDVVLYDRLVSKEVLDRIPEGTERINVGKSPYSEAGTTSQEQITNLMISLAESGKDVARLKGGDALFFSRGAEEAIALRDRGIRYEIVPGVSSALGAPAYAGIPLTHRDYSSSVFIATGQEGTDKRKKRINWRDVPSSSAETIVVLMGVASIKHIASELIIGGLDPATPVAAVESGTTQRQRTTVLSLREVSRGLAKVGSPCVFVIGKVAALAYDLNWFEGKDVQIGEIVDAVSALENNLVARNPSL